MGYKDEGPLSRNCGLEEVVTGPRLRTGNRAGCLTPQPVLSP